MTWKFSTQKRVKTEITFIKLMRPAMDNSQDIGDVVSRVTMLEGQLQKVLDDIKSGRLVNAGAAGVPGSSTAKRLQRSL